MHYVLYTLGLVYSRVSFVLAVGVVVMFSDRFLAA